MSLFFVVMWVVIALFVFTDSYSPPDWILAMWALLLAFFNFADWWRKRDAA